jgi:hypothetical protein
LASAANRVSRVPSMGRCPNAGADAVVLRMLLALMSAHPGVIAQAEARFDVRISAGSPLRGVRRELR